MATLAACGDRRRGVLAGVPATLPGCQPGRVPRGGDLGRGARLGPRRPFRRPDELPAAGGDPRVRGWAIPRHRAGCLPPRALDARSTIRRADLRVGAGGPGGGLRAVSYTHLTLPTI